MLIVVILLSSGLMGVFGFSPVTSATVTANRSNSLDPFFSSRRGSPEDVYAAVHRKEYEMKQVRQQHKGTTDPVIMAMSYAQESVPAMRLAKALRRVHEDNAGSGSSDMDEQSEKDKKRTKQMEEYGMREMTMRRASFIVDIKRKSLSRPGEVFCKFDNAALVAEAMVRLGADVVFINVDYQAYGTLNDVRL